MTKIISFHGSKESGKDTFCNFVTAVLCTSAGFNKVLDISNDDIKVDEVVVDPSSIMPELVQTFSWAESLKQILINNFDIDPYFLYDREGKDKHTHLYWENMPGVITNEFGYNRLVNKFPEQKNVYYHIHGPMTGREVLQYFGTNIMRKMWERVWIFSLLKNIENSNAKFALIKDTRFDNEKIEVNEIGGTNIFLTRKPHKDTHDSELVSNKHCQHTLDNSSINLLESKKALLKILEEIL